MLRKILRKFQPNFYHYVKKIKVQAKKKKNGFLIKKKRVLPFFTQLRGKYLAPVFFKCDTFSFIGFKFPIRIF